MKRGLWIFVGVALIATLLGAVLSRSEALRYDERWTLYNAGGAPYEPLSLTGVWQRIADDDPWQSPGYFLALNRWGGAVGWSVYAARMFSLLTGVLALAWMMRLGVLLAGRRIGLYSSVALLGSAFFAYYLHEMRPYTLYVLLTCSSVWSYWRVTHHAAGWPTRLLFVLSLIGLAYTHPLALLSALAIGLYHLLFARPLNRRWLVTLGLMALAGLAFVPWLLVLLRAVEIARADVTRQAVSLTGTEIVTQLSYAFAGGSVAVFTLLAALSPNRRPAFRLLVIWVVSGLLAALAINLWLPVFVHIRYLMALWPALALLVAFGVDRLQGHGIPAYIPLGVWLIAGLFAAATPEFFASLKNSERSLSAAGLEAAVRDIRLYGTPDEAALFHTRPPGLEWQNLGVLDVYLWGSPIRFTDIESLHPDSEAPERAYMDRVRDYLDQVNGVWTVVMPDVPHTHRQNAFFRVLNREFGACNAPQDIAGTRMQYFARLTDLDAGTPFNFSAPNRSSIGARVLRRSQSREALWLTLGSTAAFGIHPGEYAAFVHLLDASGTVVAQGDVSVGDAPRGCSLSVVPLADLPPGEYGLAFGVYERATVTRLIGSDGMTSSDRFDLPPVIITD
jgi:hypothetical protein